MSEFENSSYPLMNPEYVAAPRKKRPQILDKSSLLYFVKKEKLMRTVTDICGAWYNSSYTIMAKPIKTLELHYPIIYFLIIPSIAF